MKTRFEWRTEEQDTLETARPLENASSARKLGCLTMTLAVSAIVISLLAWQLNRRQSEAVALVTEDVLLAFELQQQAAENDDAELFSTMLSSSDLAWKRDQERLQAADLFNNRGNLGLAGIPQTRRQPALDLSPNLQEAELSYALSYEPLAGAQETSKLELVHTIVYRLEEGRWQQTAAGPSFWGSWDEVEGRLTAITFPERDAELAQGLLDKVDAGLASMCAEVSIENGYALTFCEGAAPWRIKLSTDAESLLNLVDTPVARSSDFDYELPAPSIVGIPQNESDYGAYLEMYARSLLQNMEASLLSTTPYPDQNIYALCFAHPLNGRHLYRYQWHNRSWQPMLVAQAFEHLSSLPDDSAIMLASSDTLTVMVGDRDTSATGHAEVWQGNWPASDPRTLVGWVADGDTSFHLIQRAASGGGSPGYSALDLSDCDAVGCVTTELPGFPIPSAAGEGSLYMMGSQIVVQPGKGEATRTVGIGFSPFWIDERSFGFVRFAGDFDSGINTEVVLGSLDNSELRVLFDGEDLARAAGILWESVLFVNDVVPNPDDPDLLLVSSTGIRDYAGQYYLFSADNSAGRDEPRIKLEVARSGSQGGVPGLLAPTGPPPFLVSSDGRWLAMTELKGEDRETWAVLVHDLQTGTTDEVSDSVPAMPGNFPLLDWSKDGQWLLVADREFLLLIASAYERQELIAHDFDACSHIVWAD